MDTTDQSLPSGTVTFLFTDIEDSTQLLQRLGARYADALADHRAILLDLFAEYEGQEVDTQGDAFFVAFSRPSQAVRATVGTQRALANHSWPSGERVRVRMGLHTGQPDVGQTGYVGMDVHRAARIAHVAHGGQVLLSETTYPLVRDDLPEDIGLLDLGRHRLKDMGRPEQIYQLIIPELTVEFPPLMSLDAHPNNLPHQPTPFIGRSNELAVAHEILQQPQVRLLTLTGTGGTGKTRLGLQLAADLIENFSDGVYFVPLASLTDPDLVATTIAHHLGVREQGQRLLLESLSEELQGKQFLLLLDNFEHLISATQLVADLLSSCPQLHMIITSREPLRIRGEYEFHVPPLTLPDTSAQPDIELLIQNPSVELFVQRARAVKSSFRLEEGNASTVAEICSLLDGLPLAIELAAARAKLLPPTALLARLRQVNGHSPLRLLTSGARDAPERQQTLQATLDWSYHLLDPMEQRIFRNLGVFTGSFDLQAAESICSPLGSSPSEDERALTIDVIDGVASLVDKSLLRQEEEISDEARFSMLGTVRQYAVEKFSANPEAGEIRSRHADYYMALALEAEPHLEKPDQANWLDRMEMENSNLRAALSWALETKNAEIGLSLGNALSLYWFIRGHLTEGREWFEEMLKMPEAKKYPELHALALDRAGLITRHQGDYHRASNYISESLETWRALDDKKGIADSLANLGFVTLHKGEQDKARGLYEEALSINQDIGNSQGIADALSHLALIAFYRGDYENAREMDQESLAIWQELGDMQAMAWALHKLGNVIFHQGETNNARELFERSLRLSRDIGLKWGIAFSLEGLASCAAREGEAEHALILASTAEKLRTAIGMPLYDASKAIYERTLERAWKELGEGEIQRVREQADTMGIDLVVDDALEGSSLEKVS